MGTLAAVMAGKGTGAIATIALYGGETQTILSKIFKPKKESNTSFDTGNLILGQVHDENGPVDEVLIGCERQDYFAVNCHGNPLIVTDIMRLLQKHGAELVSAEKILAEASLHNGESNTIAIEAKLALAKARTLEATRIILYQGHKGLSQTAKDWLEQIGSSDLTKIQTQAEDILERSAAAKPLLFGVKIVLAGPPNSGKSTLLNCLAGKQKAIVTELQGTTRDWISTECVLGKIYAEIIDTAGIDQRLFSDNEVIEKTAQQKAKELLTAADLVLFVLDASIEAEPSLRFFAEKLTGKKSLTVLNKMDLPVRFDISQLPQNLNKTVNISAKFATGFDELIEAIGLILSVLELDSKKPICFTDRQEQLLRQITAVKTKGVAVSVISELLNGKPRV